jgi:hypothetical protein
MQSHLRYLAYVLHHKWHVFRAGVALGVPLWQLLIHDASKFSRAEWGPYVRRFFGGRGSQLDKGADPTEFHMAWRHHWTRTPHHWEYWLPEPMCAPNQGPLPMPERYCREMVADWIGAGRAQGKPDVAAWYAQHGTQKLLHADTRALVERLLGDAKRLSLIP